MLWCSWVDVWGVEMVLVLVCGVEMGGKVWIVWWLIICSVRWAVGYLVWVMFGVEGEEMGG
jgi:hypothetical protein